MQNLRFFLLTSFVFLIFMWIVVFLTTSGYIIKFKVSYWYVLKYSILFTLKTTDVILPFITLISVIIFFTSARSQISILRSIGYSNTKIVSYVMPFYLCAFVGLILFVNYGRPYVKNSIQQIKHDIQKLSVSRLVTEKEVVNYEDISFYINKVNRQNMSLEDIILRKFDGCNVILLTAKTGMIKEDKNTRNLFLVLNNSQAKVKNNNKCDTKNATQVANNYLYDLTIDSNNIYINLFFDEKDDKSTEAISSMSTKDVIKLAMEFDDLSFKDRKFSFKEINYRLVNPFYLLLFVLSVSIFLVNIKSGRSFKIFGFSFILMILLFAYNVVSYGFILDDLVGRYYFYGLIVALLNICLIFAISCIKILYDDKGFRIHEFYAKGCKSLKAKYN